MCTPSMAIDSVVELEDPDTNEVGVRQYNTTHKNITPLGTQTVFI